MNFLPLKKEAAAATRQRINATVKAIASPDLKADEIKCGKYEFEVILCTTVGGRLDNVGPRSVLIGLKPRNAPNSEATAGKCAM